MRIVLITKMLVRLFLRGSETKNKIARLLNWQISRTLPAKTLPKTIISLPHSDHPSFLLWDYHAVYLRILPQWSLQWHHR